MIRHVMVAVVLLTSAPAYAVVPVEDAPSLIESIKQDFHLLQTHATQLQQLTTEAQSLGYAINQFRALTAAPSLANAMGLMFSLGISDPLPVSPYTVQALMRGQGGVGGTLGNLSALSSSAFGANHIYTSPDNTWASQQSAAHANSIANAQGLAGQIHQQMAAHFPLLASLRADMLSARTPSEREQVAGHIAAEQAWAANSNTQLQAISVMASLQRDNREQQAEEHMNRSLDNEINQARALGYIR